jgi:magnesium-transporting ATPase (P-type)
MAVEEAGVRVLMITGDHPATARAISREAGLLADDRHLLTGVEMADLDDDDLDRRLQAVTVIAGRRRWTNCASSRACGGWGTPWP